MDSDTLGLFVYLDQLEREEKEKASAWDLQALESEDQNQDPQNRVDS